MSTDTPRKLDEDESYTVITEYGRVVEPWLMTKKRAEYLRDEQDNQKPENAPHHIVHMETTAWTSADSAALKQMSRDA